MTPECCGDTARCGGCTADPPFARRCPPRLPLTISEADFQRTVMDLAIVTGWRVCHIRPARTTNGWRTPVEGHVGMPDLIVARGGVVILAELKTQRGRVTPEQRAWLAEAGENGRLWRPSDFPEIHATLTGRSEARTA